MPGDPFKKGTGTKYSPKTSSPKKSKPTTNPAGKLKAKAPTAGVSPGAKGGNMQGLIGQPSASKVTHAGIKRSIPKAKTGKYMGQAKGSPRK